MRRRLAERPTGDLLMLVIVGTVSFSVLASGTALFLITILVPDRDTQAGFHALGDVINTLIGLLAGFMAGRTDTVLARQRYSQATERVDVTDI